VASHEDKLLAVLEKIGQEGGVSAATPSVTDADAPLGEHLETAGPDQDPNDDPRSDEPIDPAGVPAGLAPINSRNLFVHHDAHPVVFDLALLARYETDWFEWESATLWKEIKEDFRVPSISDHACAKIQAIKTLHINEWFWTRWEVFCWITQALNNNIPDFQVIQKPSMAQLMNAVEIANMVRSGEEFVQQVQSWVAAAIVDEGVFHAPNPVAFCQDEIVQLLEELKIEGSEQLIADVQERHREVIRISPEAWAAASGPILQENAVDIQVAKLKVAFDYLALRRRQLKDQLRLLR
jgi:hypothetical protein